MFIRHAFTRFVASIPVLLLLTLVLFGALKLIPGDIALVMAGERATPERVEYIRESLHLNDPWFVQYGLYLKRLVLEADLGHSLFHDQPINTLFASAIPATVELAVAALLIAIPVGLFLGVVSAVARRSWWDRFASLIALTGVSMPIFWLALLLMWFFSLNLGWLPTSGRLSDEVLFDPASQSLFRMYTLDGLYLGLAGEGWDVFTSAVRYLVLPAVALSTIPMAHICRMTRSAMLDVLQQDYIRTARAKGLSVFKVVLKHAARNAALPVVTIMFLQAGALFGGAVITETMFAWPGLGKLLVESIGSRDFPMVQSGTLFVGCMFVLFNLMGDIVVGWLDPRIKQASGTQKGNG
ncbi:MAG: ABC transporter permease [Betaproteobacteria bacterium]|nr:ABC transporter permease [Betaproteobacteria bacterium]